MRSLARVQFWLFRFLFVTALLLAGWLAQRHPLEIDWSFSGHNKLSEASAMLIDRMPGRIEITAFARDEKVLRRRIENLIARYRRAHDNLTFSFVDPDLHPDVVRGLGITRNGELLVSYGGGERHVHTLSEAALSEALLDLNQQDRRVIRFLVGHGERKLVGGANHDLGEIGRRVEASGASIHALDLANDPHIPEDTSLLLIAGPRTPPGKGQMELITGFLERGGNLLWLVDPSTTSGWGELGSAIGVQVLPGTVVDTAPRMFGLTEPAFTLITEYPDHPVTAGLDGPTLFPLAAPLEVDADSRWQARPLLTSLPRTWSDMDPDDETPVHDAEAGERKGPLTIGVELARELSGGVQRIAVIGDGDFIANAYLGNGSNLQLGLNIFNWLTSASQSLDIIPRSTPDARLDLSNAQLITIGAVFLLVLPGALVAGGMVSWWRRRNG